MNTIGDCKRCVRKDIPLSDDRMCEYCCSHLQDRLKPNVCIKCFAETNEIRESHLCHLCEPKNETELVDHPAHYGGADDKYEHVKVAEAKGWTNDAFIYNCTRYLWRLGLKDGNPELQDLKKARWYLDRKIKNLEAGRP